MKKLLSLTTALLFCLLIVGCKNRTLYFNYDEMIEKVVKIDIIDIEELGTRRTDGISEKVVGTIDDELIDDFLLDLSKIKFTKPWGISNPQFPDGIAFLVYYNNNDYDIIHSSGTYGELREVQCSVEEYNYLVNKYYYQTIGVYYV